MKLLHRQDNYQLQTLQAISRHVDLNPSKIEIQNMKLFTDNGEMRLEFLRPKMKRPTLGMMNRMTRWKWKMKKLMKSVKMEMLMVTVLGLGLYVSDIGTDANTGITFLRMRNCFRTFGASLDTLSLGNLMDSGIQIEEKVKAEPWQKDHSVIAQFFQKIVFEFLWTNNRYDTFYWGTIGNGETMEHWVTKLRQIFLSQTSSYDIRSLVDHCEINCKKTNLVNFTLNLCEEQVTTVLGQNGSSAFSENVHMLVKYFQDIQNKPFNALEAGKYNMTQNEFIALKSFLRRINLYDTRLAALAKRLLTMDYDYSKLFNVMQILEEMGIPLDNMSLLFTPGFLLSIMQDREKYAKMLQILALLPPNYVDIFKMIKRARMFSFTSLDPNLIQGGIKVLNMTSVQNLLVSFKRIISYSGGFQSLLRKCEMKNLTLFCEDISNDLCPNGLVTYGFLCLIPILIPGIIFGISNVFQTRGNCLKFGFNVEWELPSKGFVKMLLKIFVTPPYILIMGPVGIFIPFYRFYRLIKMLQVERSQSNLVSPAIRNSVEEIKVDTTEAMTVESLGEAPMQLSVQFYFLTHMIYASQMTGLAMGIDPERLFSNIFPMTVITILVSSLSICKGILGLEAIDQKKTSLPTPPSSILWVISSIIWGLMLLGADILSTVLLALVTWIEVFSSSWINQPVTANIFILPMLFILLKYFICWFSHLILFRPRTLMGHVYALISGFYPVRSFLLPRSKCFLYLLSWHITNSACHILAWVSYSLLLYFHHGGDTMALKIITPLAINCFLPLVLIWTLRWHLMISPLFDPSTPQHSSMSLAQDRLDSFPPWWDLTDPQDTSDAGFFYSHERLTGLKVTCFLCGLEVTHPDTLVKLHLTHPTTPPSQPSSPLRKYSKLEVFWMISNLVFRLTSISSLLYIFIPTVLSIGRLIILINLILHLSLALSMFHNPQSLLRSIISLIIPILPSSSSSLPILTHTFLHLCSHLLLWVSVLEVPMPVEREMSTILLVNSGFAMALIITTIYFFLSRRLQGMKSGVKKERNLCAAPTGHVIYV